jgi:hypothetical protein
LNKTPQMARRVSTTMTTMIKKTEAMTPKTLQSRRQENRGNNQGDVELECIEFHCHCNKI